MPSEDQRADAQPPLGRADAQPPLEPADTQPPLEPADTQPSLGPTDAQTPFGPVVTQPPLGRTVGAATYGELGHHLMETRGLEWLHGANGDPYALVLRGLADDPYPLYERVRELGPLYRSPTGSWVTADHAVAREVLAHPLLDVRAADGWPVPPQVVSYGAGQALELDRAAHERLAERWQQVLGAEHVDGLRAYAERACEEVLDGLLASRARPVPGAPASDGHAASTGLSGKPTRQPTPSAPATGERTPDDHATPTDPASPPPPTAFDLMTDFARPAAVATVAAVLGVPRERYADLASCCERLAAWPDALVSAQPPTRVRGVASGLADLHALLDSRPAAADGPLSSVAGSADGGLTDGRLADGATARYPVETLLCAHGAIAAAHLVGNAVVALLSRPGRWRALCAEPGLIPAVVEETLRYDPPVQMDERVALKDVELAGHHLAAGSHIVVLTGATGRDAAAFAAPHRFDPARAAGGPAPLALSGGFHHGPVAPLVRLHAGAALAALAHRLPGLRQAGPVLRPRRTPVTRGPLTVPVTA
ncbi:cytochrome P450 [Streptomyces sp. NPDC003077]|uniref:cytochrome P450 family protein n=1 Tax=Streptomyces sp. NPDC003077 TaxID=3154443 RepID=UPI0033B6E268